MGTGWDFEAMLESAAALPTSPGASPSSASSADSSKVRGDRRHEGEVQYLTQEELPPLDVKSEERFTVDVLRRLADTDDWSVQFGAIDDVRRLTRFAPKAVVVGGHLRKTASLITTLIDSLRSALAKNALRCMGELFLTFGKRMDVELDISIPVMMKRAADTNAFIAEEAEVCLRELCKAATESKLVTPFLAQEKHRQPRVRERAVWCLAMVIQRLAAKGPTGTAREQLRSIADTTAKALGDANAEVRHSARVAAVALAASGVLGECAAGAKIDGAIPPGIDVVAFDAFDAEHMHRCAELARTAGAHASAPHTYAGMRNARAPVVSR